MKRWAGYAAGAGALALLAGCATSSPSQEWTKPGATPEDVKSALFWCTSQTSERRHVLDTPVAERRVRTTVDDDCMEKRGFTKVSPKS